MKKLIPIRNTEALLTCKYWPHHTWYQITGLTPKFSIVSKHELTKVTLKQNNDDNDYHFPQADILRL